ncbi:transcription termination/antitermination NusG family protein [Magnetovibrio sp. PR-2]|uniref:transcription termination/antitermination protein NusG n=1 Tax=Magnetovibrio sp. PR-2 TaxID=3120356 RepID=UPI002FCDE8AB
MTKWYVVRVKTSYEDRASWHLRNQDFKVYLPKYRKTVRHARKTQSVLRPVFPGYLFVNMDTASQPWRSINGTVGVLSLVQFGPHPQSIDGSIVDMIRRREDIDGVISIAPEGLKKGDNMRVLEGAFADHTALLEEVCDDKRVILLLDLMGREVRVHASSETLAKVS